MDARFQPFADTLFGTAGLELDREAQSPDANLKLDASLSAFLALLSEHFLLPAAMQALEFLVRRFRYIHLSNASWASSLTRRGFFTIFTFGISGTFADCCCTWGVCLCTAAMLAG